MSIILPTIPPVPKISKAVPLEVVRFLQAVKEILETREGRRADGLYKFLTAEDVNNVNLSHNQSIRQVVPSIIYDEKAIQPVTNFQVTKSQYYHNMTWTNPVADNLSHCEIWWNSTNDLTSAALLAIVTAPQNTFSNLVVAETGDRYYWIRAVSFGEASYSEWRPVNGTGDPQGWVVSGEPTVGEAIERIMQDLEEVSGSGFKNPFRVGTIDGISTVGLDGNMVVDGTILARHVKAGEITGTHIAANQITASHVGTNQITSFSALIGAKPPLGATAGSVFHDDFSLGWDEVNDWEFTYSYGNRWRISNAAVVTGSHFMQFGDNDGADRVDFRTRKSFAFDPNALYRMKVRFRVNSVSTVTNFSFYAGFVGRDYTDTKDIARDGGETTGFTTSCNYFCASATAHPKDNTWYEYVGYLKGTSATEDTTAHPLASAPGTLYPTAKFFRPVVVVNSWNQSGIGYVDEILVEKIPDRDASPFAYGANTTYIDGGNIYTGTLNANRITAGTITTDRIIGGAITTSGAAYLGSKYMVVDQEYSVLSVTLTTTGAPVVVQVYARHHTSAFDGSVPFSGFSDVYCDSTLLTPNTCITQVANAKWADGGATYVPRKEDVIALLIRHTPAAGQHTWTYKFDPNTAYATYLYNIGLFVLELKK